MSAEGETLPVPARPPAGVRNSGRSSFSVRRLTGTQKGRASPPRPPLLRYAPCPPTTRPPTSRPCAPGSKPALQGLRLRLRDGRLIKCTQAAVQLMLDEVDDYRALPRA